MQRTILSGMILGLLLFCCRGVLVASEADELRERAKAMRKEVEKESAKLLEAADRLESKSKGRGEDGDRPGIEKQMRHLNDRLHDLLAQERNLRQAQAPDKELAEVREQIAGTQVEMLETASRRIHHLRIAAENLKMAEADDIARKLMEQADSMERDVQEGKRRLAAEMKGEIPAELRPHVEMLETASRRIHHLRVAAENLKMAEADDIARKLMEKADSMERDVQEGKKRLAAEMQKAHGGEHGPDVARELRAEIERLRAEVKELRQKVENR